MEDLQHEQDVQAVDIFMDPPCDGHISDGDSGDEDNQGVENLNRHQLLAPSEMVIHRVQDDRIDDLNVADDSDMPSTSGTSAQAGSTATSSRTRNVEDSSENTVTRLRPTVHPRRWLKRDLQVHVDDWAAPPPRSVLTLSDKSEPIEFFELFFSEEIIHHIVRQSVLYAVSKDPNTNFCLSSDEIKCFLGILILSGYVPLPRRRMYWEIQDDTHNILVSNSMRRNRFEEILRFLHVADNDDLQPGDKMAKIRPLCDMMNEKFLIYAPIEKNFSVDESMIPYYGRHSCKQHIHGKPIRFGFKAWVAATRLGYCLKADLYRGRSERREIGLGEHVVTKLTESVRNIYPDNKFSIYCDNFFTSPSLLTNLQGNNVKITGTVRQNRVDKCPLKDVKAFKKEPRGFYDFRLDTNDNICAVRWNDNNVVTLLSNEFGVQPLQKASRYSAAMRRRIDIDQPNVIFQYNRFMGGVDRLDANVGVYRIAIGGKKWYIPILMWIIDVAVNNAALLARSMGTNVDTLAFRRSIAKSLLLKYGIPKEHTGPKQRPSLTLPVAVRQHEAQHIILTGQLRRRCAVCHNKTVKMCRKCGVNLHDKCFGAFHD